MRELIILAGLAALYRMSVLSQLVSEFLDSQLGVTSFIVWGAVTPFVFGIAAYLTVNRLIRSPVLIVAAVPLAAFSVDLAALAAAGAAIGDTGATELLTSVVAHVFFVSIGARTAQAL